MRHIAISTVVGAMLCAASAQAGVVTLDFEDRVFGDVITNQYAAQGVTFSSDGDPTSPPTIRMSGANEYLGDFIRVASTFNIRADFTTLVSDFSVDVTTATGRTSTVSLFGAADNLLGSMTSGVQTFNVFETLNLGGSDIAYAIFTSSSPDVAAISIDNLTYTTPAVPLPAGLGLLLTGLGVFGVLGRRKPR